MAGNKVGRVADKVAFITGAARGQGREHAIRLAEEGADIIAVDICEDIDGVGYPGPSEADLADTADLVEKSGRRIVTAKADVRDLESLRAALEQGVATFGAIDIVVANAGISGTPAPAALIEQSAWQTMLDINVTGVWHTVKAALPHMTNGGGSIILVSSMLGLRGGGYMAHYASAKHAVVGLMNSLANELAPQWIRVNSIHPGNVLTPMLDNESVLPNAAARPAQSDRARRRRDRRAIPFVAQASDRGACRQQRRALPRVRRGAVHHRSGAACRRRRRCQILNS